MNSDEIHCRRNNFNNNDYNKDINIKDYGKFYDGLVVKGNRNAVFLISNGMKRQFPDFHTFTAMNFSTAR